jgi:hypothetical protein
MMPTPQQQARAVIDQMYRAIGFARTQHDVLAVDANDLLAWTATLDAYLAVIDDDLQLLHDLRVAAATNIASSC